MAESRGIAATVLGIFLIVCAFLLWVGTSLDKEPYDGPTITIIVVLAGAGAGLVVSGRRLVRRARNR